MKKFFIIFFVYCLQFSVVFAQNSDSLALDSLVNLYLNNRDAEFTIEFSQANTYLMRGYNDKALASFRKCLEFKPQSSATMFQIGKIYYANRDFNAAERYAESAVNNNPDNKWYLVFLCDVYCSLYKYSEAENIYKKIVSKYPEQEYYDNLTDIYILEKKYDKAIENISTTQEKFGFDIDLALKKSDLYKLSGDLQGAETELINIKNYQPYNLTYLGLLSEFYMQTGQIKKVQPVLDDMLNLDSDNGYTFLTYALYCKLQHKTDCFYDCLSKAFKSDLVSLQQKTVILNQLVMEEQELDTEKITPLFDILVSQYPDSAKVHNLYASYLMCVELYKQACDELRKSLDVDKSDFNTWRKLFKLYCFTEDYDKLSEITDLATNYYPEQVDVMLYSAVAMVYSGEYKNAREMFQAAEDFGIELTESVNLYYFYLGVLDFYQNKQNDAFLNFEKFYQTNHQDYNLVAQYANFLCIGNKDLNYAEKLIKNCVLVDGKNSYFYYVYANCMLKKNDLKSAQYFIEKSLSLGSEHKFYYYELAGDIYFKNKNCDKAVQNWNEALNLGGNVVDINKKIKTCN